MRCTVPGSGRYTVHATDGRRVRTGRVPAVGGVRVDVRYLLPGTYWLTVETQRGERYQGSFVR